MGYNVMCEFKVQRKVLKYCVGDDLKVSPTDTTQTLVSYHDKLVGLSIKRI